VFTLKQWQRAVAICLVVWLSIIWFQPSLKAQSAPENSKPADIFTSGQMPGTQIPVTQPTEINGENHLWDINVLKDNPDFKYGYRVKVESPQDQTCSQPFTINFREKETAGREFNGKYSSFRNSGCVQDVQLVNINENADDAELYVSVKSGIFDVIYIISSTAEKGLEGDVFQVATLVFNQAALVDLDDDGTFEVVGSFLMETRDHMNPIKIYGTNMQGELVDKTSDPAFVDVHATEFVYHLNVLENLLNVDGLQEPFTSMRGGKDFFLRSKDIRKKVHRPYQTLEPKLQSKVDETLAALACDAYAAGYGDIGTAAAVLLYQGKENERFSQLLGRSLTEYTWPKVGEGGFSRKTAAPFPWAAALIGELVIFADYTLHDANFGGDLINTAYDFNTFVSEDEKVEVASRTAGLITGVIATSWLGRLFGKTPVGQLIGRYQNKLGNHVTAKTGVFLRDILSKAKIKKTRLSKEQEAYIIDTVKLSNVKKKDGALIGEVTTQRGLVKRVRISATKDERLNVHNLTKEADVKATAKANPKSRKQNENFELVEYKVGFCREISKNGANVLQAHHVIQDAWAVKLLGKADGNKLYSSGAARCINLRRDQHKIINDRQKARRATRDQRTFVEEYQLGREDLIAAGVPQDVQDLAFEEVDKYFQGLYSKVSQSAAWNGGWVTQRFGNVQEIWQ